MDRYSVSEYAEVDIFVEDFMGEDPKRPLCEA
jgi:hypothetical protein